MTTEENWRAYKTSPHMRNEIEIGNGVYASVRTDYTLDCGWETMVFHCNANGEVTNWEPIATVHYDSSAEAFVAHLTLLERWYDRNGKEN